MDTLFTDGCFSPVAPLPGSSFSLNNGDAYAAGTQLRAEVLTGVAGAENPQLRVTGTFATGWTLEFDDGFVGAGRARLQRSRHQGRGDSRVVSTR